MMGGVSLLNYMASGHLRLMPHLILIPCNPRYNFHKKHCMIKVSCVKNSMYHLSIKDIFSIKMIHTLYMCLWNHYHYSYRWLITMFLGEWHALKKENNTFRSWIIIYGYILCLERTLVEEILSSTYLYLEDMKSLLYVVVED